MSRERCFLCEDGRQKDGSQLRLIESCRVRTSQKPVAKVLQHLANCIRTKLVFQPGACICTQCFQELADYDNLMISLLTFQKKLTQQLQSIISRQFRSEPDSGEADEDIDIAVTIEDARQLTDPDADADPDVDADAFNTDIDTKEELIEVDDDEHFDCVDEAFDDDKEDDVIEDESVLTQPEPKRSHQECVICFRTFKSKIHLQSHMSAVHNFKVHACNICGAIRRDEEYLELHMNLHEGKTENECRYCPKRFSRPVNTLRHMRKHWDKKKYQCEKCGERFSQDNMLYNHRLRHEAEENPVICSICNQSFKSRKTFNHHVLIHQENRPRHHCTVCSKSFTERYTLKMHMKTHDDIIATTPTPVYEEIVYRETSESLTMTEEEDDATKETTCVICSMKFESKDQLEQHLQHDHDVILK